MATATSYQDQIMELEAQKQALMSKAKTEFLTAAEKAVEDLNNLGFNYRLVEVEQTVARPRPSKEPSTRAPRAGGTSDQVLAILNQYPDGLTRAEVIEKMNAANDPKQVTSITNSLANLKGAKKLSLENRVYKAA